jgi:RNA polymerase sigma-70 factor (ECF subfamily)
MNAAMRKTEASGDEGPLSDAPPDAASWLVDGLLDEGELQGLAEPLPDDPTAAEARPDRSAAIAEQQLAEWIAAVVDRDERALAALYDATFSRVFGLVQRIVRNGAMAEEVVEDAYFQVWRQAVRFDAARGKPLAWLLAIARSRALDALRREQRFRHESLGDDSEADTASPEPPADELLDLARHQADLHQALLLLGAQPRQLVSLAFFRGLSHEEIAEQTQLPLGTVKSQIRRALLSLRQTLGEGGALALAS